MILVIIFIVFWGLALSLKNSTFGPDSFEYFFKTTGQWLDLNFLTIGAPEKQEKHLDLATIKLDDGDLTGYERELASAYFMAEQLALIDQKYILLLENVYNVTLEHLKREKKEIGLVEATQHYNEKAIKNLLQKHQHTPELTFEYNRLVEQRLILEEVREDLSQEQITTLNQARGVLEQGIEIEWAYDLVSEIN